MSRPALFWLVSRPRFWLYLAGPYAVGFAAGASTLSDLLGSSFWAHLLYFLVPANLFLYGVNDLADADTDRLNPKKDSREHRLGAGERGDLAIAVGVCAAAGVVLALAAPSGAHRALMLAFLGLGALYSVPPARLKSRPFLDSASNVLYAVPGFLGYVQSAGALPPAAALLGAASWTAAMHLFSAVPDIAADHEAGIRTTAVALGARRSLLLCAALWVLALVCLVILLPGRAIAWLGWVYPAICLALLPDPRPVERVYWAFPALNAAAGGLLFALAAARLPLG